MINYSLNEVSILPSDHPSRFNSRSEVCPYDENNKLPIFVAPMTSVLDASNFEIFNESKVIPILPRNIKSVSKNWRAVSLKEFKSLLKTDLNGYKILIDVANGHMQQVLDLAKEAKSKFPKLKLMAGNIAHPNMLKYYEEAGIDYVRIGIGGGSACLTSVLVSVHASLPYLISSMYEIKKRNNYKIKIVADGGINSIDKAIKCLALGADYVMMGKVFAQTKEACGKAVNGYREYYGMASNKGQEKISGGIKKHAEGLETQVPILYSLDEWCNEFEASLRSAMTYTDSLFLNEFRDCETIQQSIDEFNSYYKKCGF